MQECKPGRNISQVHRRLVLITGGSGRIDTACAHGFWQAGASLALTHSKKLGSIDNILQELIGPAETSNDGQKRISVHIVDMSSIEDVVRLFTEIQQHHQQDGPDIVVSNAGYSKPVTNMMDTSIDEFDHMINVSLRAVFLLVKLAVPRMQQQTWGRFIFISSINAPSRGIHGCHYAASRAGLTGMTNYLAPKLSVQGITVNHVVPTMRRGTGMIPSLLPLAGAPNDTYEVCVNKLGQECANVVLMLCETGYVTGQSLIVG